MSGSSRTEAGCLGFYLLEKRTKLLTRLFTSKWHLEMHSDVNSHTEKRHVSAEFKMTFETLRGCGCVLRMLGYIPNCTSSEDLLLCGGGRGFCANNPPIHTYIHIRYSHHTHTHHGHSPYTHTHTNTHTHTHTQPIIREGTERFLP